MAVSLYGRVENVAEAVADRLNASTAVMIAMPGNTEIHGAVSRYVRPSFSMLPHDGVGG